MVIYHSEFDTTADKKYHYDLNAKEGPPVPTSISRKYKKEWSDLGIQAKKQRVDTYVKHMMEKEKEQAAISIFSSGSKLPTIAELSYAFMATLKVVKDEGAKVKEINANVEKIDDVVDKLTCNHNNLAAKQQVDSARIGRLEELVGGKGAAPKRRTRKRVAFKSEEEE